MYIKLLFLILFSFKCFSAEVITTLPEFAWVVKKLAPKVEVKHLLSGIEDPHFVDASPSFVFKLAKAKLLIKNGMQLEMGWLPKVTEQSGNAQIQIGGKGHCDASTKVNKIGTLKKYDRSMGDVHPAGNPHYTLSLIEMKNVIKMISECLTEVGIKFNKDNEAALLLEFNKSIKTVKELLLPISSKSFMVYHTEFNYFFRDFSLKNEGSLEEVPGVLPSALYLAKTANQAKDSNIALVLASHVSPEKYLQKFKGMSKVPYIKSQIHPLNEDDYLKHYIAFVKELVDRVDI